MHGSSLYIRGFKFKDHSLGNSAYIAQIGCHQEETLQHPRWLDHLKALPSEAALLWRDSLLFKPKQVQSMDNLIFRSVHRWDNRDSTT